MSNLDSKMNEKTLANLSKVYGNAFYLLDSDMFCENYLNLQQSFQQIYPKFNIAYSYKTNYIPKLVQIVNKLGGYAEVVSDMETEIALRSGVAANRIIWNGPIKNMEKAEQFLIMGGTVNFDSLYEIQCIREFARKHPGDLMKVGIRCNFDVGDGIFSRFGIDVDGSDFDKAIEVIASQDNIDLVSIQCHFARREAEFWNSRTVRLLEIYGRVAGEYGIKPERLDLGGGIYGEMPEELRIQLGIRNYGYSDYAKAAAGQFAEYFQGRQDTPWLFIEPGSALAGNSMKFVSRIETIKNIRGKDIATVSGSQKNISMSGINPPMTVVCGGNERKTYTDIDIAGYTCIESDYLYRHYNGEIGIGDFVVINNCGSYSVVMKPPFILPNFPIIDICKDEEHPEVIKRGECFDDLFHTFEFGSLLHE